MIAESRNEDRIHLRQPGSDDVTMFLSDSIIDGGSSGWMGIIGWMLMADGGWAGMRKAER